MASKIKLIGLDLDGTLLNREKEITPRTRRALLAAQTAGVLIVPITGRPGGGLPPAVRELPGLRYTVTSNGATIRDLWERRTLLERHLSPRLCLEVLERVARFEMIREAFREGVGYMEQGDYDALCARYAGSAMLPYFQSTRQALPRTLDGFLREDGRSVEELFFLTDSPQTKEQVQRALSGLPEIGFADPFPNDLEVIAGGIDKGKALRYLTKQLELHPEETMAIGDGGSDLPLLQAAGLGVAMGNATDALKGAADFVTATCEEDGVGLAIEKYVL